MTENEAIKELLDYVGDAFKTTISVEAVTLARKALEEREQYREIGTIEEFRKLRKMFGDDFSEMSEVVKRILKEYPEYQSIGTIEEFKALKEKNEPEKSEWKYYRKENIATCKNCSYEHYLGTYHQYATNYCPNCGSEMTET